MEGVKDKLQEVLSSFDQSAGLIPVAVGTLLIGFLLAFVILPYFRKRLGPLPPQVVPRPPPVQIGEVTPEELLQYDGRDESKPLLMAIKGVVYDVSRSKDFYGPGGPYAQFAGKDASRALAKMSFEAEDVDNPNLEDLSFSERETLNDWEMKFNMKYHEVGKVGSAAAEGKGKVVEEAKATEPAS
eukprot:TRINITY_DN4546_c0_g2_i1.p1 TRINITY_DN4546_c0_g2~~TRINITY_DN4546_c0_g2_i1.p1  ORF type:complete len:185 (+),score=36.59 TRINITY_DN4546_c0_g2_i1:215-769(+)